MKFLVLLPLSAALLVTSCGEKSSSEGSDSAAESAEPSADAVKPVPTESPGKEPSVTLPLSDADIERLLKEAVDAESLPERDGLIYHDNKPYSGWAKMIHDSGQVQALSQFKDGKLDGPSTEWHENGQKKAEGTWKDGVTHGPYTTWYSNGQKRKEGFKKDGKRQGLVTELHSNGQKWSEVTYKDDEQVSAKYWNRKGEEVRTYRESGK